MGCTGQCCVAFSPSVTLEQLRDPEQLAGADRDRLVGMLVPISREEAVARHLRFYPDDPYELTGGVADGQYYRCTFWDEETRLCGSYEDRPAMCRRYPSYDRGDACEYGCGYVDDTPDLRDLVEVAS